jgi:hypothetical protein
LTFIAFSSYYTIIVECLSDYFGHFWEEDKGNKPGFYQAQGREDGQCGTIDGLFLGCVQHFFYAYFLLRL